jgi:hypothetical protein
VAKRRLRSRSDKENTPPALQTAADLEIAPTNEHPHDQGPDVNDGSADNGDMFAGQRDAYQAAGVTKKKRTGQKVKEDELEPAMDDLINAESRGFKCSRVPVRIYFGNDKTGSCI